ncbi:MAG: YggS family pyridoxal phosphate-dependent enzyme [Pseudomonadota bacterium]
MSLQNVQTKVTAAARAAGRDPADIQLIAISKVQPTERVAAVLEQGHKLFGENRVQEAAGKWPGFRADYPGAQVHLVGPLQTNKTKQAMGLVQAIHTVDREKLARKIATEAQALGRCPELFIQVNTGEEEQKAGVAPSEVDAFVQTVTDLDLPLSGLMCIPPIDDEPALHFALLGKLAARNGLSGLSMGMSGDYETAIALGATHIRVGSAIFGARVSA